MDGAPELKRCTECGEEKPLDEFHKGVGVGGRLARCKVCINRSRREKYQNNPAFRQKAIERQREYNLQPWVKEQQRMREKEYRQRPDVKEKKKEYYQRPDVRERIQVYKHRPDVMQKAREYGREYYQNPEVKERVREHHLEYYKRQDVVERLKEYYAHPLVKKRRCNSQRKRRTRKEVREREKEYRQIPAVKIKRNAYHKTPTAKLLKRIRSHKRRILKKYAIISTNEPITPLQWSAILNHQNNRCQGCGKRFTKNNPATMDHIVPLSVAPLHTSDNIRAVCAKCNSQKGAAVDPNFIQTWVYVNGNVAPK